MLSASEHPFIRSATKICVDCGVEKPIEAFTVNGRWRKSWCKECDCQRAKRWREATKIMPKAAVESKKCPKCERVKSRSNFCLLRSHKDGLSTYCKECRKVELAKYNRSIGKRVPTVAHKVCSECGLDRPAVEFYNEPKKNDGLSYACRGCTIIRSTEWVAKNPEKARALWDRKNKKYAEDGRYRIYARRWRARHPNSRKEYYHRNFERDRDKLWLRDQRRRARLAGLPWNFSKEDKADVMEMFEHKCAFCGSTEELTMEHVIPVHRRDVLNPGTVRGNIIPLCKLCNDSKGTKLLEEYLLDPKMVRPQISEHLQARDATVGDLVTEIRFFLYMLK